MSLDTELTPQEKKKMRECIASVSTILICGSIVMLAAQLMETKHILMFTYGMGLLTRPLTERVNKLIERK